MSNLIVISHPLCPYVQRVSIALAERGTAFERIGFFTDAPAVRYEIRAGGVLVVAGLGVR
jgi:hypothetical protein